MRVPTIVLNGSVTGDVYASEKVTLAAKARVTGNVFYKIIEIQGGAQVNGQLLHEKAEPVPALTHQPESGDKSGATVIDVREVQRKTG